MNDKVLESYIIPEIATEGIFNKEKKYTLDEAKYAAMNDTALAKEMVRNLRANNVILARASDPAVKAELEEYSQIPGGGYEQISVDGYPVIITPQKIFFKKTTVFTVWFDGIYFKSLRGKPLDSLSVVFTREELIKHLAANTLAKDAAGIDPSKASVLESYMIATEGSLKDALGEIGVTIAAGGLVAFPAVLAMILHNRKLKKLEGKKTAIDKVFSKEPKAPTLRNGETNASIEQHLRTIDPKIIEEELAARNKFFKELKAFLKTLDRKIKKQLPLGGVTAFEDPLHPYDYDDDPDEFAFLTEALPAQLPDENYGHYSSWAYHCGWALPVLGYDVFAYVDNYSKKHPDAQISARSYEDTEEMWKALDAAQQEITKFAKSKGFYHCFSCGGDWDDGSMDLVLRPSEKFMKFVNENSNFPKWEMPNSNYRG